MRREQQKEGRRQAIVDSAEALIRAAGSTDFSVGDLASGAEVSVATLYNLIGSKASVLYILLNRSLDEIVGKPAPGGASDDPYQRALLAGELAADTFTRDPALMRPLYRFLLGVADPVHRPRFMQRSQAYWESRLSPLAEAGVLPKWLTLAEFAHDHHIFFAGALDLWVQQELDDTQFRAQIKHGGILRLLALGHAPGQARLIRELGSVSGLVKAAAQNGPRTGG